PSTESPRNSWRRMETRPWHVADDRSRRPDRPEHPPPAALPPKPVLTRIEPKSGRQRQVAGVENIRRVTHPAAEIRPTIAIHVLERVRHAGIAAVDPSNRVERIRRSVIARGAAHLARQENGARATHEAAIVLDVIPVHVAVGSE